MKLLLIIFPFISCEDDKAPTLEEMSYSQSGCFGVCPIYSITIDAQSTLKYIGIRYVTKVDTIYEWVSNEQLHMLSKAFDECNYYSMNDEYISSDVTDMSTVYTSIRLGGKSKSVTHYLGDHSAPDELNTLYSKIKTILNTQRWTGR